VHDLCFGSRFHKTLGLFLLALDAGCGQAAVQAGPTPGLGDAGTGVGSKDAGATLNIIPSSDDASIGSVDLAPPTDLPPPLTDFPSDPVLDGANVPANAPDLFTNTTPRNWGAPCIVSPEANTLMPMNWLRPRFEFLRAADENLFEIQLTVAGFAHPLLIYTAGETAHAWHQGDSTYALDANLWNQLRNSVTDQPITVTIRALTLSSTGTVQNPPSLPATSSFTVAPVEAPGKIVYWALAQGGAGSLKGFGIGEEAVEDVLLVGQVKASTPTLDNCIGCHAATPDGLAVGMVLGSNGDTTYFNSIADIQAGTAGNTPSYVDPGALATLRTTKGGTPAFSLAHWVDGDRIVITSSDNNATSDVGNLHWLQLDSANQQGVLARTGDSNAATEPTFSHDGQTIAYVSSPGASSVYDGRLTNGPADIYSIPYGNRQGGTATPIAGASDPNYTEYYPAYSPDDAFIAFTRMAGNGNSYSNSAAEVFLVPAAGGVAQRLAANDVAACLSGVQSPGLTNDWPKWSPQATSANGKTYYWLTFSSKRSGTAQLFVTAVVLDSGSLTTYPAMYLWNQPPGDSNHTPSWDNYQIPPIVIQ
jgi:hypothetical protein